MTGTLIFLGNIGAERLPLDLLAGEFGWSIEKAASLDELREIGIARHIVAVLFDAQTLGLERDRALRAVQDAASNALPIVCHRSSEPIRWPVLAKAGAFHALLLPLHASELRQSLAFVSGAQARRRSKVIPMPPAAAAYSHCAAAGTVA
jgi:hypothetical protein